ncbi:hypothetical protein [Schlesneria sp. T3-172]|uniref:hypothetical protein n=1 Tax=Schlesneria sphaerica TaxID=3373610 RepID=UPI0037CC8C4B
MMHVRRLTLQLTPLLDLMLIVIFAQYMEVRIVATQEADRLAKVRESVTEENAALRQQVDQWELQQRSIDQSRHDEREQLGQLVRELFKIPEATLTKFLQPRSKNESGGISPADVADLKARFQQLASSRGDEIVDHLLTFNEMRKQFDVWELYMQEDGSLLITIGQDRQRIKSQVIESAENFVDTILQVSKKFPTTKNSVLMLCSYGNCRLRHRLAMSRGLPALAERLKGDGGSTQKFDYAVFGYRPQPELGR